MPVQDADNEARFRRLLETHRGRLAGISRSFARNSDGARVFKEILVRIWNALPDFEGRTVETTWVYRVALNAAMTYRRTDALKQTVPAAEGPANASPPPTTRLAGSDDELAQLWNFMTSLNEVDRVVFLLFLDDLSYREMADVTGLTVSHLGVKLHRIRRRFVDPA